jgi:16S rRNA (uracil1498-N3)-methyltransferase
MPRFFIKSEDISEGVAVIRGQDAFHIARSLRMAVGDSITVSDGEGVDYNVKLTKIRDEECLGDIVSSHASLVESPALISLYVAYPKGDKLETVIQKAVELGANRIIPFESSRCIKRPKAEKCDKLLLRLNRIAEEAAKQCGRARLPSVCAPMDFKSAIADAAKSELSLFCYENEDGYKEIPFGMCENVFGKFPQKGYADQIGTVPSDKLYACAASGAWARDDQLIIKVQIIDDYFGNLNITAGFREDGKLGIFMKKTAEDFLQQYDGFAGGTAIY